MAMFLYKEIQIKLTLQRVTTENGYSALIQAVIVCTELSLSQAERDISIVSDIIDGLKRRMYKFIAFSQSEMVS